MTREELIRKIGERIDSNRRTINDEYRMAVMKESLIEDVELLNCIKNYLQDSDDSHDQGMRDIWGLWQKVHCEVGFNANLLEHIFGYEYLDTILERLSPGAALEKFKAYEQKKREEAEKPVVGDVVIHSNANDKGPMTFIVININDAEIKGLRSTGETCSFIYPNSYIKKTGKHVDLEGLFE